MKYRFCHIDVYTCVILQENLYWFRDKYYIRKLLHLLFYFILYYFTSDERKNSNGHWILMIRISFEILKSQGLEKKENCDFTRNDLHAHKDKLQLMKFNM